MSELCLFGLVGFADPRIFAKIIEMEEAGAIKVSA